MDFRKLVAEPVRASQREGIPPSIEILAMRNGHRFASLSCGHKYKIYDVASLTKILVTTPLIMILTETSRLKLDAAVSRYLPFLEGTPAGHVPVRNLLRHLSGLKWWQPYYKELVCVAPLDRKAVLQHKFRSEKRDSAKKCVYSDLDFLLLGWIVEELFEMNLDEAVHEFLFKPMGLSKNTFFGYVRSSSPHWNISGTKVVQKGVGATIKQIAPTMDTRDRGRVQGEPMDHNTWSLGGVAGHAGLFSTLSDVNKMAEIFLESYLGRSSAPWSSKTMKLFTRRAVPASQGDWALGFSLPTLPTTNAGRLISKEAFGHWAYTGPSLWIDPRRRMTVTILANRTFPQYKDEAKYKKFLNLRRQIHDGIWELADAAKR